MEEVTIDAESLEALANYAADDLRNHMDSEMEPLEAAVREAYNALEE